MKLLDGVKYRWQTPHIDQEAVCAIAVTYSLSFPIAQALYVRGFTKPEQIDEYLFSSYTKDVSDPVRMKDCQKAVDRIMKAIDGKEAILVCGDYDVDGITSSALVMRCLLPLGAVVNFFIPHRVKDGYGLSTAVVERAARNGYSVIITVDNGITAFEPVKKAQELGIDVLITDHHRPHGELPDAYAIVNPNQESCHYPYKHFAGVGVIFKVLSHLYTMLGKDLPAKAYELLLLGTVADVVPLTGENRFWVRHGLHYINTVESNSFQILKRNGKLLKNILSSSDIGYSIAPQINALGRLEDPRQGVQFLIGSDKEQVERTGRVLLELNEARKTIERSIYSDIVEKIEKKEIDLETEYILCAASQQWPPGVIGLVATRLVAQYGRPVLLFHITSNGMAKGSCRSIPAFNMFDALQASADLLTSFGGHSLAAGLALPIEKVSELKNRLEIRLRSLLTAEDLIQKLSIDASMILSDVTKKLLHDMKLLEPFGHENRQPLFLIENVVCLDQPVLLKDAHVKCQIFSDGVIKPLLFFNRPELFRWLLERREKKISVVTNIGENHWDGKTTVQLLGIDIGEAI
jgi:single-stranded-DNA-specific exonuclease